MTAIGELKSLLCQGREALPAIVASPVLAWVAAVPASTPQESGGVNVSVPIVATPPRLKLDSKLDDLIESLPGLPDFPAFAVRGDEDHLQVQTSLATSLKPLSDGVASGEATIPPGSLEGAEVAAPGDTDTNSCADVCATLVHYMPVDVEAYANTPVEVAARTTWRRLCVHLRPPEMEADVFGDLFGGEVSKDGGGRGICGAFVADEALEWTVGGDDPTVYEKVDDDSVSVGKADSGDHGSESGSLVDDGVKPLVAVNDARDTVSGTWIVQIIDSQPHDVFVSGMFYDADASKFVYSLHYDDGDVGHVTPDELMARLPRPDRSSDCGADSAHPGDDGSHDAALQGTARDPLMDHDPWFQAMVGARARGGDRLETSSASIGEGDAASPRCSGSDSLARHLLRVGRRIPRGGRS